ncbi:MAG: VCBS repeat-containing protein [Bryobacteraceae bacterium]|nr:VCBS repeat-containing protein [Bryobacteraceae bacterium]
MRRPAWLIPVLAFAAFERVQLLETTSEDSAGVSLGDLNGDGRLDIVLAKGRHKPLHDRVLLNDGKGGYIASNLGPNPDRTYSAALADIDRDGDLDVVSSNDTPDAKLVYLNDGRGRFAVKGGFGDPKWVTRYVTLADLNGDKYPDIVAANRGGNRTVESFACLNDRAGSFPKCEPIYEGSATAIAASDFDGDNAIDLFIPHRDGGQSVVLWNNGQGRFPTSTSVGPADTAARIAVAGDLNGDGCDDIVFIEERRKGAFLALNLKDRRFAEPAPLPGRSRTPYALALADLDGNGHLDVVVGNVESPGAVFYNEGRATSFREGSWNDGRGVVYGVAFADIDGDGALDIVAARSGAPNAIWFGGTRE